MIRRLVAMGMLTPESSVTDPAGTNYQPADALIDKGFTAMLGPVMKEFDDHYDCICVSGIAALGEADGAYEDSYLLRVTCGDQAINELIGLGPVIDVLVKISNVGREAHLAEIKDFALKPELPHLSSSDVLRWFGWIIEHHDAFANPSCWPYRLKELDGDREDNGEPLPVATSEEIEKEVERLRTHYPYLLDPDPYFHPDDDPEDDRRVPRACISHQQARDQIAVLDPELASILYSLAIATATPGWRNDECFACVCITFGDRINDALERLQHNINQGYYDTTNELFNIEAKLEDLPAEFAKIDAWFQPVTNLNKWIHANRTVINA